MDPLSITAAIIAITTAAVQSVQCLTKTIDSFSEAPDTVKNVRVDLNAIRPVLQNLLKVIQGNPSQISFSEHIAQAIQNCETACRVFQLQVERWMRHSSKDKLFWVDRWKVGLLLPERIKTFRGKLTDCKGTLSIALSTATIITASRQESLMKEMRDMMLQHNEVVIRQQITQAEVDEDERAHNLQQLTDSESNEPHFSSLLARERDQSKHQLLQELEKREATNSIFREICEEALSKTVYERTGQMIKRVKATNHSSALAGFINTSGQEHSIFQDISDITADNRSIAVVGVVRDFDFKSLYTTVGSGSAPGKGSEIQEDMKI